MYFESHMDGNDMSNLAIESKVYLLLALSKMDMKLDDNLE